MYENRHAERQRISHKTCYLWRAMALTSIATIREAKGGDADGREGRPSVGALWQSVSTQVSRKEGFDANTA